MQSRRRCSYQEYLKSNKHRGEDRIRRLRPESVRESKKKKNFSSWNYKSVFKKQHNQDNPFLCEDTYSPLLKTSCKEGVDSSAKATASIRLNMPDKTRKRQSEAIRRKKKTVIEKIYKLGQLPGIDVAFFIRQNGRYTTYQSLDAADFPQPKEHIVSGLPCSVDQLS